MSEEKRDNEWLKKQISLNCECGDIPIEAKKLGNKCAYCWCFHDLFEEHLRYVDNLMLDVLHNACYLNRWELDNMGISDYKIACRYLESKGLLKDKEHGRIYKVIYDE